MTQWEITFLSHNRKAQCKPNPDYPDGVVVDNGIRPACACDLPYPAPCVGTWLVKCNQCGTTAGVTAAGRPDDPKALLMPCKGKAAGNVNH